MPENLEDPYNIDVSFYGEGWTEGFLDAFVTSLGLLSGMIASDLPDDMDMSLTTGEMVSVDDLQIEASLSQDDGVGGVV